MAEALARKQARECSRFQEQINDRLCEHRTMTSQQAVHELTQQFRARLRGLALQHRAAGEQPMIPAEAAEQLAQFAVQWARQHGMSFDDERA